MATAKRGGLPLVIFTAAIDAVGFGIVLPVLPRLIMDLSGQSVSGAALFGGWLSFAYAAMQFLCAPILGNLSDRFGRRPVVLSALFIFGIDYLVMGSAPSLAWLFLGRIVAGVTGASFAPAVAYVADVSPPEKRAQNFGLIGAAFGIGLVLGPAIGGVMGQFGTRVPFLVASGLALLNCTFGFFFLPESLQPESRRPFSWARANPIGAARQIAKHPSVLCIAGAVFLWQVAHQVLPSTWTYYTMLKFHWTESVVGYSLALAGVVMVIGQGFLTRTLIPRMKGERNAAFVGLGFAAMVYVGYAFAPRGWIMNSWTLVWLMATLAAPSLSAMMSRRIPASSQGELQGALASISGVSAIIGPLLMTHLFQYFSAPDAPVHFPGAPFLASAVMVLVSIGLVMLGTRAVDVPPHVAQRLGAKA